MKSDEQGNPTAGGVCRISYTERISTGAGTGDY